MMVSVSGCEVTLHLYAFTVLPVVEAMEEAVDSASLGFVDV
jgi:hypothetical protein